MGYSAIPGAALQAEIHWTTVKVLRKSKAAVAP
jgi:hypothetical protein